VQYINDALTFEEFDKNDVIVLLTSTTGTGKSTSVAKHMHSYLQKNPNTRFLSIVALRALARQHMITFSDINISNYMGKTPINY
jgi:Tfp pilus assembly pilus retraction ATPase PilT